MKICLVKQPFTANLTWKSYRYSSPQETLDAFPYRSQNISLVIGKKADIWVAEGMAIKPPSFARNMNPRGIRALYKVQKTVPWDAIPWDEYDIVISWTPIVSDEIIEKHPKILWVY